MLKQTVPLKRKTPLKAKTGLKSKKELKANKTIKVKGSKLPDDVPQWNGLRRTKLKVKVRKTPERTSILTKDMKHCYLCGSKGRDRPVQIHEIYYGPYRDKSIEYACTVPLCLEHHTGPEGVHLNWEKVDLPLKQKCQLEFEKLYSHEEFMKIFKHNYL